jgi:hypothetical protein
MACYLCLGLEATGGYTSEAYCLKGCNGECRFIDQKYQCLIPSAVKNHFQFKEAWLLIKLLSRIISVSATHRSGTG